jgi:starch synthase (maltosyl-transferring)
LPDEDTALRRVAVENVRPAVDRGAFPVKRTAGEPVVVAADVFADAHDMVAAFLWWRRLGDEGWHREPMAALGNDVFSATFTPDLLGRYEYEISGLVDRWASVRDAITKRHDAGLDVAVELEILARLVDEAATRARGDRERLREAAGSLRAAALEVLDDDAVHDAMLRHAREHDETRSERFRVDVDRERARFSTWYELFPRSAGPPGRHGTFLDVVELLPRLAAMGFDVLYLPPIHPIGVINRKGANNATTARRDDPGSPWAIGSAAGGHTAVHPELGTLDDFRTLVREAGAAGIDVALDLAFQASPDHPWFREHPEWFRTRPDGTIQHAENPPKRYEDIVPFDFETEHWRSLWRELRAVVEFWIDQGVRIFRVDNPHTKPFAFWDWLLADLRRRHPDLIFLAEAFTRPRVLERLAKIGFNQSYTYFAWRTTAWELREYFEELTTTTVAEYLRPNVWPNTPDILTEYLQDGGRSAFAVRAVLAATLAASYGIYGPAFELHEHLAREQGSEEYLDSEKYEIRHRDLDAPMSLRPLLTRLNAIRRGHPALQTNTGLRFHDVDNPQLLCYSKRDPCTDDVVVTIVTVDPFHPQSGFVQLDLRELGVADDAPFRVRDELGGEVFEWRGPRNYVALDARGVVAHVLTIDRARARDRAPAGRVSRPTASGR